MTVSRRSLLAAAAALPLAGCGGTVEEDEDNVGHWRILHLGEGIGPVDVLADASRRFTALAEQSLSAYDQLAGDSYEVEVRRGTSVLHESTRSLVDGVYGTHVLWGREGALQMGTLDENQDDDAIPGGKARVRVYVASADSGSVDVYLTASSAELDSSTPLLAAVAAGATSAFAELSSGTWRLRVVGSGDTNDLRLDVASVAVGEESHVSIVLTSGSGGVLMHAAVLPRRGALALRRNTAARLRVVASATARGAVTATLDGTTIAAALRSPTIGPYALVAAGSSLLEASVDGVAVSGGTVGLDAGADYTVLVWGAAGARRLSLLAEDNRLPGGGTRTRLRVMHGLAGEGLATLSIDLAAVITGVAEGAVSAPVSLASGTGLRIDATTAASADPVYTATDVALASGGLYTTFLLDGGSSPTGVLRKER